MFVVLKKRILILKLILVMTFVITYSIQKKTYEQQESLDYCESHSGLVIHGLVIQKRINIAVTAIIICLVVLHTYYTSDHGIYHYYWSMCLTGLCFFFGNNPLENLDYKLFLSCYLRHLDLL